MTDDTYADMCGATAKSTGEPCQRPAGWGTDSSDGRCKFHGGASPGGQPGNDGGAPEGNQNAMQTGIHSDPVDLFNWLVENDPDAVAYIFDKLHGYAEDAPQEVFVVDVRTADSFEDAKAALTGYGDNLLLLCIRDYTRWRGSARQLKEGLITTQTRQGEHGTYQVEDSNPVNLDLDRQDRTTLKLQDKYDLLPGDDASDDVSVPQAMWDALVEYHSDD